MPGKSKKLIRVTISVDQADYEAMGTLATVMDVSTSWLMRKAMRDFLDRCGKKGQPKLALEPIAKIIGHE